VLCGVGMRRNLQAFGLHFARVRVWPQKGHGQLTAWAADGGDSELPAGGMDWAKGGESEMCPRRTRREGELNRAMAGSG